MNNTHDASSAKNRSSAEDERCTRDERRVLDNEAACLQLTKNGEKYEQPVGIAFSGGGIRSASFGLGVMPYSEDWLPSPSSSLLW